MAARIRAFDWRSTPLGRIDGWAQSLKTSVSLILSSRHPMWIGWGPEMTFLYNDAYLHVLGPAKHPDALGRPAAAVWAEIWDVCGPLADKVFRAGEASFVDDVRLFMNRGNFLEETFYSFSYSPIRDESGRVSGLFCPSTDVTPKILNARRLGTLSALAANALAEKTVASACASSAATLSRNPDDIPFALLYLVGESRQSRLEQAVGCALSEQCAPRIIHFGRDPASHDWPIQAVYERGERQLIDTQGVPGLPLDAAEQPVARAMVLPVSSRGEHEPYGVLVAGVSPSRPLDSEYLTFLDLVAGQVATAIQNAKQVEEEKKRADMLAELDRAKTVFFSNVSHEFRTPLTLMLGPLESLLERRDRLDPDDHEHLVIAHRNSLRLLKLVNSLLDFSRIEAGRVRASFVPTDLSALTASLASNFRSAMETAGLQLIIDCPPLSAPVYVDHEMWEKIVLNLLSNAFKFTFEGSVTVWLRQEQGLCTLTIADTGIGIPEAELPHIFERFHRVEGAKGRTYEGTGIGLALIHEFAKLHGGGISVDSAVGAGSTFRVTLPLGSAHLAQDRVKPPAAARDTAAVRAETFTGEALTWTRDRSTSAASPPISAPSGAAERAKPRVLIADDNADMREHVSRVLGDHYEVVTANDGREALAIIGKSCPDLVLSDVMMPELDGFGLLRAVRSQPETHTVPVIFLSARAGEEMRVEGLEAGADDYLVKPFTANELRARVGAHVQMAIARRRATEREAALRGEAEAARDRLIQVLESITDGFIALDKDWRFTYVNAEAERLNGMKREQMLGRNHWELFPDAVGTIVHREIVRAAQERTPSEFENYYAPWDRWFHVKAYPGANGGAYVFYEDISERKRAEAALRTSEERFRQLADSMPQIIWTARPDGYVDYYNARWYEFTGADRSSFGDGSWEKILHPDDRQHCYDSWYHSVRSGSPYRIEYRFWDAREHRWRWFMGRALPIRGAAGEITKWFGSCTDIDEQKRVEDDLRRVNQDLEQFAYSASHDLQEPLRGVKIYTELLTRRYREKLDGEALQFLEFIRSSATRMEMLIRDLLAYTQVTRLEAPAESTDANEAFGESIANLDGAIAESRAVVSCDALPAVPVHATHLKQLFQNLIGNAVKYRSPDRDPRVHVGVDQQNGRWLLSVSDNGIGIEPQYKERIFGLFKRLHTGDEYSGTGIGLAICQRIVERYHGRIWVESEPGRGSKFFFTLPV